MSEPKDRKPISISESMDARGDSGAYAVLCDDGAVFTRTMTMRDKWLEIEPIPGSARARQTNGESVEDVLRDVLDEMGQAEWANPEHAEEILRHLIDTFYPRLRAKLR